MNFDQFIEKLQKTVKADSDNPKVSFYDDGGGRLRIKDGDFHWCPITYVANRETSKEYSSLEASVAGKELGLDQITAWDIMDAADADGAYPDLLKGARKALAKAMGISINNQKEQTNDR